MKKSLFQQKALFIGLIITINLVMLPKIQAEEIVLDDLQITNLIVTPHETTAEIEWTTNYPTWGAINYGVTDELGSRVEDIRYQLVHEMSITGLIPDQLHHFNIEAYDQYGRQLPLKWWGLFTIEEVDTTAPILNDVHTPFISGNSVQFVWYTNEWSKSCVFYGTDMSNLDQNYCDNDLKLAHDVYINNLERNKKYYYRVYSEDDSGNGAFSVYYNVKTLYFDDTNIIPLTVEQTHYEVENTPNGKSRAIINFKTNRPVSGELRWGISAPSNHVNPISLSGPRSTDNQIIIENLEPENWYIYIIDVKDLFNITEISDEFYFLTPPADSEVSVYNLDADYNPYDLEQDFDQDGLTNGEENLYGTSQIKSDTDGDGLIDGWEVNNGFDPLGPGLLTSPITQVTAVDLADVFAYEQPRSSSLQLEVNAANQLKFHLQDLFGGAIPVAASGWPTLVNSYVYGGYPVEAIYKAIIYSGRTVHPKIPWTAWRNSVDYQEYINK